MKNSLLHAIWLGTALIAFGADAPKEGKGAPEKPVADQTISPQDIKPFQKEFLNLPQERREQYAKHMNEAFRLFGDKRVFETLDELAKADAIYKNNPDAISLYGSCQVEFRAFDKALDAYKRADALAPKDANIYFNIGEVYFVTKKWKQANEMFESVLKLDSENVNKVSKDLSRLAEFKILLCKIKENKLEEAQVLSEKYDFLDDSPYYYFSKAALDYQRDNLVGAEEWLSRAARIFQSSAILSPWQDTLIEFGYIKSFYGDDAATAAAQ